MTKEIATSAFGELAIVVSGCEVLPEAATRKHISITQSREGRSEEQYPSSRQHKQVEVALIAHISIKCAGGVEVKIDKCEFFLLPVL